VDGDACPNRPCFNSSKIQDKSYITTDGRLAGLWWNKHPSEAKGQIFITDKQLQAC
jgi:hypothetical protein